MTDHERIWLQSYADTEALGEDRLWCEDKVWPNDPEDHEPTEYVRADLYDAIIRERDELRAALEEARTRMRNARGAVESNQVVDKDVRGTLTRGITEIDAALKGDS